MASNLNPSRPQQKQQAPLGKTYGKIKTSTVNNQLWLTRLPENLATVWDNVPEGTLLGTITLTKGTPAPKKGTMLKPGQKQIQQKLTLEVSENLIQSKVSDEKSESNETVKDLPIDSGKSLKSKMSNQKPKLAQLAKDLPLDYSITNLTTKIPVLHPFNRRDDGSIEMIGTVNRSCNLQMEMTKRYRNMCNVRMADAEEKHYVKSMDEQTELSVTINKVGGFISNGSGFGGAVGDVLKKINEAPSHRNNKRTFSATQTVRSILFELFSQQTHWAMKELRAQIGGGRTEKEIRTDLQQIADYHKTGEFKGFWQLKTEFAAAMNDSKNDNGNSAD